ncbi:MAG: hypothetical protein EOM14_11960, partial [Clostridia bacterium]|nr:hypothetical protein [Clostridia bacterium]
FYIRDEETGHVWSPTPLPVQSAAPYICRHGFGYSVFTHMEDGIHSELWIYVSISASVKFMVRFLQEQSNHTLPSVFERTTASPETTLLPVTLPSLSAVM